MTAPPRCVQMFRCVHTITRFQTDRFRFVSFAKICDFPIIFSSYNPIILFPIIYSALLITPLPPIILSTQVFNFKKFALIKNFANSLFFKTKMWFLSKFHQHYCELLLCRERRDHCTGMYYTHSGKLGASPGRQCLNFLGSGL